MPHSYRFYRKYLLQGLLINPNLLIYQLTKLCYYIVNYILLLNDFIQYTVEGKTIIVLILVSIEDVTDFHFNNLKSNANCISAHSSYFENTLN